MKISLEIPGQYCAGLGDCLTWAAIAAGSAEPMEFVAVGKKRQLLQLFGATVTDDSTDAINPSGCYRAETNFSCSIPRVEIWQRVLRIDGQPVRPQCVLDAPATKYPNLVLLAPQCTAVPRTWPLGYWVDLADQLEETGRDVVWVIDNELPELERLPQARCLVAGSLSELINLIRCSALLIGNDSMPSHLAGTLGISTLALLGPTKPTVFSHLPAVKTIWSHASCVGCHFTDPYRTACNMTCQAMNLLMPNVVCERAIQIMEAAK